MFIINTFWYHFKSSPFPSPEMSETGSKYIDREVENAINGVKQMKILMDETKKDHQQMLNTLEDTKKKKEVSVPMRACRLGS